MSWIVAQRAFVASVCGHAVAAGDDAFRGDVVTTVTWCKACALRRLRVAEPDVLPLPPAPAWVAPPAPQPALFDDLVPDDGQRFAHVDARRELERLQRLVAPPPAAPNPDEEP